MAEQYARQQFLNDDIMQLLEATPDNSKPSDLPSSLAATNIPEQREKLAVLVSTGKSKEALGSQLINRRNAFQTKIIIEKSFLMLGSKAIGMFVKVDGLEALLKDMEEEFIFNSVLSWKLFQKDI